MFAFCWKPLLVTWHVQQLVNDDGDDDDDDDDDVGIYAAGPCSVTSIRRGEIFQRHDCALLFYDINTDVIHWTLQQTGDWRNTVEKNRFKFSVRQRAKFS